MADIVDRADIEMERELERGIASARAVVGLKLTGRCYNCGEVCPELFCDSDCRDDYEKAAWFKRNKAI